MTFRSEAGRTYTASEVCEAAQVKQVTLRAWRLRGLVVIGKTRAKGWTRYTQTDVDRIVQFAALVRSGFRPSAASKAVFR